TERRLRQSSLPEARVSAASLAGASRERLRLWDLSPQQMRALEESGQARRTLTIYSPIAGVVIEKMAVAGQRVEPGMTLYRIADRGDGRLVPREVRLGGRFDDAVEVLDGVAAGERVVTSANFLVDSESKLQAAESMMGMMGALGMGHVTMEGARPMQMAGGEQAAPGGA